MAKLVTIDDMSFLSSASWSGSSTSENQRYCQELESGNILFFPQTPFPFPADDLAFLLAQRQTEAAHRKNIAYKPQLDKITNYVHSSPEQDAKLLDAMRTYSNNVVQFLKQLLPCLLYTSPSPRD